MNKQKTKHASNNKIMSYKTTAGWSLISSGVTTLFLKALPGKSLWWGIAFLVIGGVMIATRNSDVNT